MTKLTKEQQQDADIKKMKSDLKKQKNTIEKLEKRITSLLDQNKMNKKSKVSYIYLFLKIVTLTDVTLPCMIHF